MAQYRGFDFFDYVYSILKRKTYFIILGILLIVGTYLFIYFTMPPRFDSTSTVVAIEDASINPLNSISNSLSSLPFASLGFSGFNSAERYNLFITLIFSRTSIEKLIDEFNIMENYGLESEEKAIKIMRASIETEITLEGAFQVVVRGDSPKNAALMNSFLLDEVNETVIRLNTKKYRENRIFLEERLNDVKLRLQTSEDALQSFQEKTNMLEVENQTKALVGIYTELEAELALKESQYSTLKSLKGEESPLVEAAKIELDEMRKRVNEIKNSKKYNSLFLSIGELPENAKEYLRLMRQVKINNSMLEFILPLLEQAKIEEAKSIPVLQVVDKPSIPEKKSYPPRTIFTILIAGFILFVVSVFLYLRDYWKFTSSEKLLIIKNEMSGFFKRKKTS